MESIEIIKTFPWLKFFPIQQLEETQSKGKHIEFASQNLYQQEDEFQNPIHSNDLKTIQETYIDSVYDFLDYISFNPAGPKLKREDAKSLLEYYAFPDERTRRKTDVRRIAGTVETNDRRRK